MATATRTNTTLTPQSALTFGSAAIVAGTTAASARTETNPDAELIAACAEFLELERQWSDAYCEDDGSPSAALTSLQQRLAAALDRVCSIRAVTVEGFRIRAETYNAYASEELEDFAGSEHYDERMLAALLRDLAGGTRV